MIQNPILKGFNPDPSICKKGDDYYLCVSSFEWLPGLPIYHSKDLKNWELYTHVLTNNQVDLKKLPSAKGIWAPHLTYNEKEDLFYVVYGVMNSMNARYFDVDNFLITASELFGEWSEPVYLHSSGFDASIFIDDDGRQYITSLEWETRDSYEKPGVICLVEYSPSSKEIIGYPKRIWAGGTNRGCIEAPIITKRGEYYYLMCAEGGTGYNHCVTMARSKNIWGQYVGDLKNPIVTSAPNNSNERHDPDHLKPKYYNPESILQKSGHASYVETSLGEVYLFHLTSRPFVPELRCTLGRETAIQKMIWTEDGWLRMEDGSNLAKIEVLESALEAYSVESIPELDDFDSDVLGNYYYAPRIMPSDFASVMKRDGFVRLRGQESQVSLNKASILARKLSSVNARITTKMEFKPEVYQHDAGLILYYDNMNFVYLRKYYSETLGQSAIAIVRLENGEKIEFESSRVPVEDIPIIFRLHICEKECFFEWAYESEEFMRIGEVFDTTKFSDEYCKYGEFTGTMVGITCADKVKHKQFADFDYFEYINK